MEIIHIGLYGGKNLFGGKENKLRAEVIRCDKCNKCSYYREKTCMGITAPFAYRCKFAKLESIEGYTSRAAKYYEFRSKYTKHEKYNVLERAKQKLGLIDGIVVLPYSFLTISQNAQTKQYETSIEYFGHGLSYVPIEDFTPELIYKICTHKPYAMMGGYINDYQEKEVPKFLGHLSELLSDLYNEFVEKYPIFKKDINYIGRTAKLTTIVPGDVSYSSTSYPEFNEKWKWDGEFLEYAGGYMNNPNIAEIEKLVCFKFKPKDSTKIKITSNEQVDKNTIFID